MTASMSLPSRTRALATDTTTLPRRRASTSRTVWVRPIPTGWPPRPRRRHRRRRRCRHPRWPAAGRATGRRISAATAAARSGSRDPRVTAYPGHRQSQSQTPAEWAGTSEDPDDHGAHPCTRCPGASHLGRAPRLGSGTVGLLDGKRILITGVLTDASLAFGVARLAQEEGAEVVLSGAGRGLSLTRRVARKLPVAVDVLEIDVTDAGQLAGAAADLTERWGRLDGLLHAIGFAPADCLGGDIMRAGWDDVAVALQISAYSLKALVEALRPLLVAAGTSSVVSLDFDARVAWPAYDWMGVAKAALESLSRYLARDLGPDGVRVNLVAAGPVRTMAAKSIPSFAGFEATWGRAGPARVGRLRRRTGGPGLRGPFVGLVPGHHGRDGPRGRRGPRHGRLRRLSQFSRESISPRRGSGTAPCWPLRMAAVARSIWAASACLGHLLGGHGEQLGEGLAQRRRRRRQSSGSDLPGRGPVALDPLRRLGLTGLGQGVDALAVALLGPSPDLRPRRAAGWGRPTPDWAARRPRSSPRAG
jgi:enoyl ACP reductase